MPAMVDEGAPPCVNRLVVTSWAGERIEVASVAFGAAPFARHFHDAYAVGLVRAGANRFRHGRALTEAGAGSLCLVNAGEVHDGGLAGEPWAYRNVHLPPGAVARVAAELGVAPEFGTGHVTQPAVVAAVADFLALALQLPPHARRRATSTEPAPRTR